jgi:hypothetical protein
MSRASVDMEEAAIRIEVVGVALLLKDAMGLDGKCQPSYRSGGQTTARRWFT